MAPQVVFEVLSPGNRPAEMIRKFQFYQQYGVEEYYIYDPDNGSLDGWLRVGDRLEEVPEMAGFVSPRLGIRFDPGEGPDNLEDLRPRRIAVPDFRGVGREVKGRSATCRRRTRAC